MTLNLIPRKQLFPLESEVPLKAHTLPNVTKGMIHSILLCIIWWEDSQLSWAQMNLKVGQLSPSLLWSKLLIPTTVNLCINCKTPYKFLPRNTMGESQRSIWVNFMQYLKYKFDISFPNIMAFKCTITQINPKVRCHSIFDSV